MGDSVDRVIPGDDVGADRSSSGSALAAGGAPVAVRSETPMGELPPGAALLRAKHSERFWTSYLRSGFIVAAGECIGTLWYFHLTPSGPSRAALTAIVSVLALGASGGVAVVDQIATRTWRSQFSLGASLFFGLVLAVCAHLDGGLDSPLLFLLALPVANAALGLRVRAVIGCVLAVVVEAGVVALADPHVTSTGAGITILGVFLSGMVVLSIGWATTRERLQADESDLLAKLVLAGQTDTLTGCLNHGAFFDRLDAEIDRALRRDERLCLLMADVDLFKAFNDSHGHEAGDNALAGVGALLRGCSRSFDVVGRVGGDEFAVILPATPLISAQEVAARIVEAFIRPGDLGVTVSVGVGVLSGTEPTAKRLFRDTDSELYRAKANGRACVAPPLERGNTVAAGGEFPSADAHLHADLKRLHENVRDANTATAEALAILDTLEASSSIGFAFINPNYRILRINSMLAAVNGGTIQDQLGHLVADVVPQHWPTLGPAFRTVLETGEPLINQEVVREFADDPGHPRYLLETFSPVKVATGLTIGICVVGVDITDRKELEQSQASLTQAVVDALAGSVEMRDPYTAGHQQRVAQIAIAIATELRLGPGEIEAVGLAAKIHDIGKLAVPTEILVRPGRLGEEEMALVRHHARAGSDMLERVGFPEHTREMILQHHERVDGSGYPNGLRGDRISLGARIIAVADVVDAMASRRPYRNALGAEIALKEIRQGSGTLFDPDVVGACLTLFQDGRLTAEDT